MRVRTPEQLKGQVKAFANKRNLMPQEVLQIFFMERVLDRLSKSQYSSNFILKGGLLISSMVGVNERTTMDIDTTVTGIEMDESEIEKIISEILSIDVGDGIIFKFGGIVPIRDEDEYNNYCVHFKAIYGKIANDMKIDITTGDAITPAFIDYSYKTIMDEDIIPVKAYNIETIIAEKYETIIRRNIANTRARDYYDLYKFYSLYKEEINIPLLKLAVERTSQKRESGSIMTEWQEICEDMVTDTGLNNLWRNYCRTNTYAENIDFVEIMKTIEILAKLINI